MRLAAPQCAVPFWHQTCPHVHAQAAVCFYVASAMMLWEASNERKFGPDPVRKARAVTRGWDLYLVGKWIFLMTGGGS